LSTHGGRSLGRHAREAGIGGGGELASAGGGFGIMMVVRGGDVAISDEELDEANRQLAKQTYRIPADVAAVVSIHYNTMQGIEFDRTCFELYVADPTTAPELAQVSIHPLGG
jgi:hypothetical protein